MNQTAWIEEGRQLYSTHANSQFVIGDWVNVGIQAFGRTPAFNAAQQITGTKHTRTFFTRCAAVASYYKPALRFPKLHFHTYEVLARFPLSFLEQFIPAVAESGRSCKAAYELACEQYGSDPRRKRRSRKFHSVQLPETLFHSLAVRASSPDKTHLLIVRILSEWEQQQGVGKASVPDSPSVWSESPAMTTQTEKGAEPESPKPSYAERREQQIAGGAQPIAPKLHRHSTTPRKCTCKIKVAFVECRRKAYVENFDGSIKRLGTTAQPTRFKTEEEAVAASLRFVECHGYSEEIFYCAECCAWHLRHKYSARNIAAVLQQHAQS
jgi:hypothetical protein